VVSEQEDGVSSSERGLPAVLSIKDVDEENWILSAPPNKGTGGRD
jgi:hypothetical protein